MRLERLKLALWLLVIGSWGLGVIIGRWWSVNEFVIELSKVVQVVSPLQLGAWWHPIVFMILSVVGVFVLSQVFLGVGASVFLFARGMYDSTLIMQLEGTIGGWTLTNVPMSEVWIVSMLVLILAVNLPLCLWSGQLGAQRGVYVFYRLRGKTVDPDFGSKPFSKFLLILTASIAVGVVGAIIFSYA
ncbi:hypothetical protein AKJ35_00370 [candidate division MSBL1 archaeon SCGC-AAA833F18]|uniref:Uncharacterized protein n=1 Tax=candidate division MSBL1 archaeon SCGC-AAA833F18 TaxID=1698257 RepID=A0A133VT64_9EURY|nr:hypothetical protein AKJ35_00370 [candidate division MSBL1 archaeon SCGC-AAA833F18]